MNKVVKQVLIRDSNAKLYKVIKDDANTIRLAIVRLENNLDLYYNFIIIDCPYDLTYTKTKPIECVQGMISYVEMLKKLMDSPSSKTISNDPNSLAISVRTNTSNRGKEKIPLNFVLNYTLDPGDPFLDKFVNFKFTGSVGEINQVNILYSKVDSNVKLYYEVGHTTYSSNNGDQTLWGKNPTMTFFETEFHRDVDNELPLDNITMVNTFGFMYKSRLLAGKFRNIFLSLANCSVYRGKLTGVYFDKSNNPGFIPTVIMEKSDIVRSELGFVNSSEDPIDKENDSLGIQSYTVEFSSPVQVAGIDLLLVSSLLPFSTEKTFKEIDFSHRGKYTICKGSINTVHTNNNRSGDVDSVYMDKVILYKPDGGLLEIDVINLVIVNPVFWNDKSASVNLLTYAYYEHQWFPIGELIHAYGTDSINGKILTNYLKIREDVLKQASEYYTKMKGKKR